MSRIIRLWCGVGVSSCEIVVWVTCVVGVMCGVGACCQTVVCYRSRVVRLWCDVHVVMSDSGVVWVSQLCCQTVVWCACGCLGHGERWWCGVGVSFIMSDGGQKVVWCGCLLVSDCGFVYMGLSNSVS